MFKSFLNSSGSSSGSSTNVFNGDNTGATDVGAAINAWAAANNGIVELDEGVYLIDTVPVDPSVTDNDLILRGKGKGKTIIKYGPRIQDDAGNICGAIAYNLKLGSSDYDAVSARIGKGQTAIVPLTSTITGISSSATTPTVTTSAAHNLASGVFVYISGVTCSVGLIPNGMYMAVLDSSTTATTFRLHTVNGVPYSTASITYSSGGTAKCYFNRYSALTINGANGDYLWACTVSDASQYKKGDNVHIHSQDDYLAALAENRWVGEKNDLVYVDTNTNMLYFQRPIAFAHIYNTSPLVTCYKGSQKVLIEDITFTNNSLTGDPMDYPFITDGGSQNISSAIDILGVVSPEIRNCEFVACWARAVRYSSCPNVLHINNTVSLGMNGDIYNNVVEKDVTAITAATPPVVTTSTTHNIANGNPVVFRSVVGPSGQVNNEVFQARNVNAGARTFELYDLNGNPVNGSAWPSYVSGGKVSIANVRLLGYGVDLDGATSGKVSGGATRHCRHPVTTDGKTGTYGANKWMLWGQPTNITIEDLDVDVAWGPGIDFHEEGRFVTVKNCVIRHSSRSPDATGTYAVGMHAQVRCLDVSFIGCVFIGGKQQVRLANTNHTLKTLTKFHNCVFSDTSIVETSSGNKEGAIIIDSSEATNNAFWPKAECYKCDFINVGAAVYMSGVSAVNVTSIANLYNCNVINTSTVFDCGAGAYGAMHGGVIDYSNQNYNPLRRRAVAYCAKLRDDATAAVGGTAILNGVTIIRGETTNQPAALFERTSNNGISKYFWARNCTIINPSNLSSGIPIVSAWTNMVELSNILDSVTSLNVTHTNVGNVGAGEDNLQTYTVPADTLYTGRAIDIKAWGSCANNANAKTVKLYFGSLALLSHNLTISQAGTWRINATVIATGDNTQGYSATLLQGGTTTLMNVTSGTHTQNDGSSIVIKCTGTGVANNDIVQEGMLVTLI